VTNKTIRDYQVACVASVLEDVHVGGKRELYYQLPTGGGKTYVASQIVQNFDRSLFIAHRKELIQQTAEAFRQDLPAEWSVGICMAEQNDLDARVTVGSIQTLSRGRLDALLARGGVSLVLIDEGHHITKSNSYKKLIDQVRAVCPDCPIVACTATPYRADKESMQEVLPHCSFSRTIEDLQGAGYLAPTVWTPIHIDAHWADVKKSSLGGEPDYNQDELAERLFPQMGTIVSKSLPLLGTRPFVAFTPNVAMAQQLAGEYRVAGCKVESIWGEMPADERKHILADWKAGMIQGVVNCAILTEGFDFPDLAAIVVARPTMSPGLYLQMVGRVTRPKSGLYQDALIIDVCGNGNLIQTKQIVLPKVLEAISSRDEWLMEDPSLMEDISEWVESEKNEEESKSREYKILDPLSKSWVSWLKRDGFYVASLGNEATAVLKRDATRGLWRGFVLWPAEGGKWRRKILSDSPYPLREIMGMVNAVIAQNGIKHLVEKRARWRQDLATERQVAFLTRFSPQDARQARRDCWTKGEVALRITYWQVQPVLERL